MDKKSATVSLENTHPFTRALFDRARAAQSHIVLPESEDDRILQAAAIVAQEGLAQVTLLGKEEEIRGRAGRLQLEGALEKVQCLDHLASPDFERYTEEYAKLRAHKGVTVEEARQKMADVSYFATMMVHTGAADGMVSGAAHTTAHTIRPALEFVKTKPNVSVVSSVFFMLLPETTLVYGDCAVNPNPTPEQLADIAASSAETAKQFGFDPAVALLSYSTGSSGFGKDVDLVYEAVSILRERHADFAFEGPIQYDAASDDTVAAKKMPDSPVAGRANVFIFPDLNSGNITYKAVQRTAGAIAVGPVLQGLNKPVNDLSRGALVEDIVNTVAVTAVQAAL